MKNIVKYKDIEIKLNLENRVLVMSGKVGHIKKQFNGNGLMYYRNKLFFLTKVNYKLFYKYLNNMYVGVTYGYFVEISFIGLGYRFLKLKNYLLLKLGFSHYIKYIIPKTVYVIGYKRKLLIYGMDIIAINIMAKQLRLFKKPNVYKGKGIQLVGETLRYKIGKQK